ncbi:hypothetical protein BD410DRAFT_836807 [Rickenella mellea]|uniref:SEC7 domain-containing protein n=1 Tax=Rickenella mellea TaxID=50990 RepID=A0A4Y7QFF3_9AGAM|nr:hypothetical protein BD410DRAFT_836807 [Rickenella mellea]
METSAAAEQRANAVAKLRRAASLPRMKNGRRPAAHGETVSDGEPIQNGEEKKDDDDDAPPVENKPAAEAEMEAEAEAEADGEPDVDTTEEKSRDQPPESKAPAKRRSRSRSRSRGSKDLKAKMRALETPPQSSSPIPSDGMTTDDQITALPESPFLKAPSPRFMQMQMAQHFLPQMSPFQYAGSNPSTPVPSLETLQSRHLMRSNSAAARLMAMHKLTGGTEPLDPSMVISPVSPISPTARLGRNNTVSGGERTAARELLLRRLNERIGQSDADHASDREDNSTPTTKGRKRRSRRKSSSSSVVDDRDLAALANTPTSNTPAPLVTEAPPPPPPPVRSPHATPIPASPSPLPLLRATTPVIVSTPSPGAQSYRKDHEIEYDSLFSGRGPVVEEQDDPPIQHTPPPRMQRHQALPSTPTHQTSHSISHRGHHTSDAPSTDTESITNGLHVPVILSHSGRTSYAQDMFPKSPFGTPIKEETDVSKLRFPWTESDREISWVAEPVPQARIPTPLIDREISWAAEPVPEVAMTPRPSGERERERDIVSWVAEPELASRMPVYDEDEDEEKSDAEVALDSASIRDSLDLASDRNLNRHPPSLSPDLVGEPPSSQDNTLSFAAPSHTDTVGTAVRESDVSSASGLFQSPVDATSGDAMMRTRSQSSSTPGWDESQILSDATEISRKRSTDGSFGTLGRVINRAFSRSGSSAGRRSRTNSIATRDKKENTESSRESGASVISGKRESKGDASGTIAWQQGQTPLNQSPSASTSMLTFAPPPPRGVSPMPPPSDAESSKYANPKLFPFPGMVRLQEESRRTRGMSLSTPDIVLQNNPADKPSSESSTAVQSPDSVRDRKLSHQASDSQLLAKYQQTPAPAMASAPSNSSQIDYFNIPSPPAPSSASTANFSLKLPTTREGVKKWLKIFSQNSGGQSAQPTPGETQPSEAAKKPSLSDLLRSRKEVETVSDWEDMDKLRAPTSASTSTVKGSPMRLRAQEDIQESSPDDPLMAYQYPQFPHTPVTNVQNGGTGGGNAAYYDSSSTPLPSPADMNSTTPDPFSSADESPGPSLSQSSHASASSLASLAQQQSAAPEVDKNATQSLKSAEILQRLDQVLRADKLNPMWSSAISTPPRRLLLSSPMLQVVNSNTVKDRFLFLFSDILVIAKPLMPNRDSLLDNARPYPPDRKFVVKSVVQLRDLRLNVDRDDDSKRATLQLPAQRPSTIIAFAEEFTSNPDAAIAKLLNHEATTDKFSALGRLLVQLPEIDKAALGDYFSRRSSRHALKGYLDAMGFTGMAVDVALRLFLLSIHIPTGQTHANALEYLLDTFAGRWYEANAGIVAFDKDLAVRLVRAIVRLNEALHSSHDSSSASFSRHYVNVRDFTEAFRRHDPRSLVPDGSLEKIYTSIRHEKLCQARNPTHGRPSIPITLKRSLPSRLTYRRQSDPIVVRIPQVDSRLTVQLHGQDLTFEPSVLTFSKSTEASFRVTGTSLGLKTMVMACSGPNAPSYSGIPLSSTVLVERAFMRNTFQVAFLNHQGMKRKYMFSVDDPVIRQEWTSSLKRQIDLATSFVPDLPAPAQVQIYRAAEALSFSVLRDTLLSEDSSPSPSTPNDNDSRDVTNYSHSRDGSGYDPASSNSVGTSKGAIYARSQSRSRMYRLGPGKAERDLHVNGSHGSTPAPDADVLTGSQSLGARLWTSHELELLCQQNSSIALVLSFLQAALPYDVEDETFSLPPLPIHTQNFHQF